MTDDLKEPAHSELPPSSSDKWMHCDAWRRLNHGLPDESSEAAEEGTRAHEWLADHLEGKRDLADCDEDEMADLLMSCVEWVENQEGERHVEIKVDFGAPFGFENLTGTSDLVFVTDDMLTVADLKYGKGLVEVTDNTQLLIYLVGAVHKYGRRKRYRLAILQPRAWHERGWIRTWEISDLDLQLFEAQLEASIAAQYDPKSKAKAGNHCFHFCKAFGRCRSAARRSLDLFRAHPIEKD